MTRNQIEAMVDELAEEVRTFVFQTLDAEIWINGQEAGRVASAIEHIFRQEIDRLFDFRQRQDKRTKQQRKRQRLRLSESA